MSAAEEKARTIADPAPRTDDGAHGFDLATIERQAARYAHGQFGLFMWVDDKCAAAGLHTISPWWKWSVGDFYASGKQFGIYLVGRGGGKSSTLERVAAADSFFVQRKVPPGQTWTWPFISVGPDDANRRIDGIAAVYRAIGLPVIGEEDTSGTKQKEGVKIARAPRASAKLSDARGNPVMLASIAGTIGNVSGPSTIGGTVDEAAKLLDKSTNANPLTEIIASLSQTSRARPGWRAIICSSAWAADGSHYQLVLQGDNETNYVARIGAKFLEEALRGFDLVAAWEEKRSNAAAAARIRAHASSLTAESPMVPTWVANPTLGHPEAQIWDGAALASRKLVEVLPEAALDGLSREDFWLRENGSVPLGGGDGGADGAAQIAGLAEANAKLTRDVADAWRTSEAPRDARRDLYAGMHSGGWGGGWTGGGGTL